MYIYKLYIVMFPGFVSDFVFFISSKIVSSFSPVFLRTCGKKCW